MKGVLCFSELPTLAQNEFRLQFEGDFEFDPENYVFRMVYVPCDRITEELDNIFGPNLIDAVEDGKVGQLAEDIAKYGMKSIPMKGEGVHRKLACHRLGRGMWRYEPISATVSSNHGEHGSEE